MIQYAKITLKGIIDEVIIRLGDHRSAINLDWDTLVRYANHSIREIASLVIPYEGEAFLRRMTIANESAIPREFVRRSRLLVERSEGVYDEARYADIKEYFNITNSINIHDFNHSYDHAGIYTFWGQADTTSVPIEFRIYTHPTDLTGILDYYSMPAELTADTDVVPIPEEYIDIVIYTIMQRIFARTTIHAQITEVQKRLAQEKSKIFELYIAKQKMESRELDSFIEPVVPLAAPPPEKGEASKKL